jgi:carbonic anhydrase
MDFGSDAASVHHQRRIVSRYLQESHERIFANNRKWVATKLEEDPQFFDKLSKGQSPDYL